MDAMSNHDNSPQQAAQEKGAVRGRIPSGSGRRLRIPSQMDFFLIYPTRCFPLLTHTKFLLEKKTSPTQPNFAHLCISFQSFFPCIFVHKSQTHPLPCQHHCARAGAQGVFSGNREGTAATPGSLQALGTCQHCLLLSFTEGTGSPSRAACGSGVQKHSPPLSQLSSMLFLG